MNRKTAIVLLVLCAAGFLIGLVRLFNLRFESGDVYPPYSSLRSDPLGAEVLYESLRRQPDLSVARDLEATDQLPEGNHIAYFQLAASSEDWEDLSPENFTEVTDFLHRGGRLVVALLPEQGMRRIFTITNSAPTGTNGASGTNRTVRTRVRLQPMSEDITPVVSLKERWGLEFGSRPLPQGTDSFRAVDVRNTNEPSLPSVIAWHSPIILTNLSRDWRVLYSRDHDPVVVERKFGSGSVVFATDTFFLSNEAMARDRHPALLAWLVGDTRKVYFDESHFGIVNQPGIAGLFRKYRLEGFIISLLLLAVLFIWRNSVPLAPYARVEIRDDFVEGRDSTAGFINLLRRHVGPREVLEVCFAEWKKSGAREKYSAARRERVEALMRARQEQAPGGPNAIETYLEVCNALRLNPPPPGEKNAKG